MKTTLKPIFSNFKENDPCPNLAKPSGGVAIHPDLQSTFQERCNASDCARQDSLQTWTQLKFCNDKNWLSFTLKWPKGAFKPLSNASNCAICVWEITGQLCVFLFWLKHRQKHFGGERAHWPCFLHHYTTPLSVAANHFCRILTEKSQSSETQHTTAYSRR